MVGSTYASQKKENSSLLWDVDGKEYIDLGSGDINMQLLLALMMMGVDSLLQSHALESYF